MGRSAQGDHIEQLRRMGDHVRRSYLLLEGNPRFASGFTAFGLADARAGSAEEAVTEEADCGILLDVNNVHVSATNNGFDALSYLKSFPLERVGEIHLAGHAEDVDDTGAPLLIDAHDRPVDDAVWALYAFVIQKTGPLPTLIEWDNDVPEWPILKREAQLAEEIMNREGERFLLGSRHG
mgnify:CR=1 FL=1